MKYLIYIPVWKRPFITRICFEGIGRLLKEGLNATVLCSVSRNEDFKLCREYGFDIVNVENHPLGNKMNEGIEYALLMKDFDRLINMGSDNLLSPEIIDLWNEGISGTSVSIVTNGCQIKRVQYNTLLGAGRMIERWWIEDLWKKKIRMKVSVMGGGDFEEGGCYWVRTERANELIAEGFAQEVSGERFIWYDPNLERGLDDQSRQALVEEKKIGMIECNKDVLLDIKSEENIWKFDELDGRSIEMPEWVSEKEKAMIDEIGRA